MELNYNANNTNRFRFNGMYWDAHTQTYMTHHRHFNPRTGRWLTADPHWDIRTNSQFGDNRVMRNGRPIPYTWAILQSGNLYVGMGNNPVMFHDPEGLFIKFIPAAVAIYKMLKGNKNNSSSSQPQQSPPAQQIQPPAALPAAPATAAPASSAAMAGANSAIATISAAAAKKKQTPTIAGRGTTGNITPSNLNQQLAMQQVVSNPLAGATKLPITMTDPRWPASEGWVKKQNIVRLSDGTKINIHFVYNESLNLVDDFKFK